jgi:hypothetical protein
LIVLSAALSAQSQSPSDNTTNNGAPVFISQECCDLPNAGLDIGFYRPSNTWEGCTVIAGGATVFYPTDGTSGSIEACINLPRTTEGFGNFEIYNIGDFNPPTVVGNYNQICQTFNYPELNEDEDEIGHKVLTFYVTLSEVPDEPINNIVRGINGSLSSNNQTCTCDGQENQSFGYRGRLNDAFNEYYDSDTPVNLSDLVSAPLGQSLSKFQAPSVSASTEVDVLFNGTLNVDINYDLGDPSSSEFSTLTLGPDAKINVLAGNTLTIRNTEIAGCQEMWGAVTVEDGATLNLYRSRVRDGENAITVKDGGTLMASETAFKNNWRSIYVPPKAIGFNRVDLSVFGSTFDFRTADGSIFSDPDFLTAPLLLSPFSGQTPVAGGEFHNVRSGITFAYMPAGNTNSPNRPNEFRNIANGLVFVESSGTVTGSLFSNIVDAGAFASSNGIYVVEENNTFGFTGSRVNVFSADNGSGKVSFDNMRNGILIRGGGNLRATDTEMTNVTNGVYSRGGKRIDFFRNHVESAQNGLVRFLSDDFARSKIEDNTFIAGGNLNGALGIGIISAGTNRFFLHRIKDNNITLAGAEYGLLSMAGERLTVSENNVDWSGNMFGTKGMSFMGGNRLSVSGTLITGTSGQPFTETTGMEFLGVGRPSIRCNTIDDVEIGMFFFGNNQSSSVRGNLFQDAGIGMQLGYDIPFVNDPTIIGEQEHHGNRWTGTYQGFGAAFFNSDLIDRRLSLFTVNTQSDPTLAPSSINPLAQTGWFVSPSFASTGTYTCPEGLLPTNNLNEIGRKLTNFLYSPPGNWTATVRDANYRLYRAEELGEISSAAFTNWNNWINHPDNSSIPDFYDYEVLRSNLAGLNPARVQTIDALLGSVSAAQDSFYAETMRYYFDTTANTSTSALIRLALQDSIETLELSGVPLQDSLAIEYQANVQTAANLIAGLPTGTLAESNLAATNDFTHIAQTVGVLALKPHQSTIVAIAEQCPLDGGEAVYQARAMAFALDAPLTIDSLQNCEVPPGGGGKSLTVDEKPGNLKLYPIPANEEINFSTTNLLIASISLVDMNGRPVRHKSFGKRGAINGVLTVSDLTAGVYVVKVQFTDGTIEKQLAIIQQ